MIRAGVFIGIDQTGGLQKLNDAAAGAERMYEWALSQGMPDKTHAKLITDAGGKRVTPDEIYDAIKAIIDGPGVDQLIVYFAGHGVNINRGEQWLLTDAPARTSAAVNVAGSVDLARYCGIQHVVFISDACRVAAEGIQAQNVRGIDVFPNDSASERTKPVDQFFACVLGRTAAELKDPKAAAQSYTALYTDALLDALEGSRPEVLEPSTVAGEAARYLRLRTLEQYLEREIPRRVKEMQLERRVNQNPDAIITSDQCWVSRIEGAAPPEGAKTRGAPIGPAPAMPISTARPDNLRGVTQGLVRAAISGASAQVEDQLRSAGLPRIRHGAAFAATVDRLAAPFGADHFESGCGIKVRGTRIVEVFGGPRVNAYLFPDTGDGARIDRIDGPAASVMVRFDGDVGAVIPVMPGFIAGITFEDGALIDVSYEPSANDPRYGDFKDAASETRALRALAASSTLHGRFRLDADDAAALALRMEVATIVDPTLAVYAAYAYHDLQAIDRIRELSRSLRDSLGFTLFDVELLGRALVDTPVAPPANVAPFLPLLSQGWALLRANRVRLHPALDGIESTMRDSLWSLFDAAGLDMIRKTLLTGDVR